MCIIVHKTLFVCFCCYRWYFWHFLVKACHQLHIKFNPNLSLVSDWKLRHWFLTLKQNYSKYGFVVHTKCAHVHLNQENKFVIREYGRLQYPSENGALINDLLRIYMNVYSLFRHICLNYCWIWCCDRWIENSHLKCVSSEDSCWKT